MKIEGLETMTNTATILREDKGEKVILPFRYAGGKYYALKKLEPFWEGFEHDEYREPFLGGGAVFWAKSKANYNILNDIDEELMFTLGFIKDKNKRQQLIHMFENEREASREVYACVKNIVPKNDLERAYRYYYLNRTSFSGKMRNPTWGYRPKRSLPPYRWFERIIPCGEKLEDVDLRAVDFEEAIMAPAKGKKVLMFLDPPYYTSKQESHYSHPFTKYDHVRLCSLLKQTKYNFFLTYDDCPEIRQLYDWAYLYDLNFYYRIGNSRDNNNRRKVGDELVITNYLLDSEECKVTLPKGGRRIQSTVSTRVDSPIVEKIRSPIRFTGSKYQAIKFIAPFWSCVEHDEYREPFFGGGAVFFAKPLARINWINDIDKELALLFRTMADKHKREVLKKRVVRAEPTKDMFEKLKYSNPKDDMDRVYRYFVINRTAYSGIMHMPNWGYHVKKSVPPSRWPDRIEQSGLKLQHATITNLDYEEVIATPKKGKEVFMFIDPPYFAADQKRAYRHSFPPDEHFRLLRLLKKTKHKFCLTYDNCEEIKDMYSWANIHEFSLRYHTANANVTNRKMGKELIITNY